MIIHGQGGTGKSVLLAAISNTFNKMGAPNLLAKTAMTGVAASIVGGQTLHTWAALPVTTPRSDNWVTHPTKEADHRRKKNMGSVQWLTMDEKSMLTTPLLAHLAKATSVVRAELNAVDASIPFGGLNIVLLGDFHQFPPIASHKKELYHSTESTPPTPPCEIGRNLFEQFDVVIKLEQQMRIQDLSWEGILQRSQTGDCTKEDIIEIRKLVLTNPACDVLVMARA